MACFPVAPLVSPSVQWEVVLLVSSGHGEISKWPYKKHLTQLLHVDLAKTVHGEPGSHDQIPLASWKRTPYTWNQHRWAVFLWVSLEWGRASLKEQPTALMVIQNTAYPRARIFLYYVGIGEKKRKKKGKTPSGFVGAGTPAAGGQF